MYGSTGENPSGLVDIVPYEHNWKQVMSPLLQVCYTVDTCFIELRVT